MRSDRRVLFTAPHARGRGIGRALIDHVTCSSPIPTTTRVSPARGSVSGGTQITITGTGFTSGATVVIGQGYGPNKGAIAATDVQFVSSSELIAASGPHAKAGTFNVFVTTESGTSANRRPTGLSTPHPKHRPTAPIRKGDGSQQFNGIAC